IHSSEVSSRAQREISLRSHPGSAQNRREIPRPKPALGMTTLPVSGLLQCEPDTVAWRLTIHSSEVSSRAERGISLRSHQGSAQNRREIPRPKPALGMTTLPVKNSPPELRAEQRTRDDVAHSGMGSGNQSALRSARFGFLDSIRATLFFRVHALICFSRA